MKPVILLLIIFQVIFTGRVTAQVFINGGFENNTAVGCTYNLSDVVFNTKVPNVHAYGKGYTSSGYIGETDIQTLGCYITPQNGNWCIGLSSDTAATADAVTMELTSNLVVGQSYELSFYVYGNPSFNTGVSDIKIGVTSNDSTFGNLLYTYTPTMGSWKRVVYNFIAAQSSKYISVTNTARVPGWNQIDNFTLNQQATSALYYRSRQSGNWNDVNTWESSPVANFSTGVVSPAASPPHSGNSQEVLVWAEHIVIVTADVTTHKLTVSSAGTVRISQGIQLKVAL